MGLFKPNIEKLKEKKGELENGISDNKTVQIGNQIWMAENLNIDVGEGCWCYNNDPSNCAKYGKLYTWEAAKRAAEKVKGWHLPDTNFDWGNLLAHYAWGQVRDDNSIYDSGRVYKELIIGGNSGYNILIGGFYYYTDENNNDIFRDIEVYGRYWSSTPEFVDETMANYVGLDRRKGKIYIESILQSVGCSVRLIKD